MSNFYCKCCGSSFSSISALTSASCSKNPEGRNHALYEGSEKKEYFCKYCGSRYSSISGMTSGSCSKNPSSKKYHTPAL